MKKNIEKAQQLYAGYGITMIQDGMVGESLYHLLKMFAEQGLLKMDVVGYVDLENCRDLYREHLKEHSYQNHFRLGGYKILKMFAEQGLLKMDVVGYVDLENCRDLYREHLKEHSYQNHFRLGGYKIFLDGSPQGRTAWMKEPYEGSDDCGYPVHSDDELYRLITEALEDGAQLLAHCNGDAAAEQYVAQFTKVMEEHPDQQTNRPVMYVAQFTKVMEEHPDQQTNRPVMIHAQLVREEELKKMKKLEMIPSFFVAHTYYWGDIHLQNFGKARAERISPVQDAIQAGLRYTFHQDTPVLPPDMMKTIGCAVNRVTREGVLLAKEQRVTVQEALEAVTRKRWRQSRSMLLTNMERKQIREVLKPERRQILSSWTKTRCIRRMKNWKA